MTVFKNLGVFRYWTKGVAPAKTYSTSHALSNEGSANVIAPVVQKLWNSKNSKNKIVENDYVEQNIDTKPCLDFSLIP